MVSKFLTKYLSCRKQKCVTPLQSTVTRKCEVPQSHVPIFFLISSCFSISSTISRETFLEAMQKSLYFIIYNLVTKYQIWHSWAVVILFFFFLNNKFLSDLALMSQNYCGVFFWIIFFFHFFNFFIFNFYFYFFYFCYFYFFDWQQWATKDMTMVEILSTLHIIFLITFPQGCQQHAEMGDWTTLPTIIYIINKRNIC